MRGIHEFRRSRGIGARVARASRALKRPLIAFVGLLVAAGLTRGAAELYADWLWFDHLGHGAVLVTRWCTQLLLFLGVGALSLALLWANVAIVRRMIWRERRLRATSREALWDYVARVDARFSDADRWARRLPRVILTGSTLLAVALGAAASSRSDEVLRLRYATPFGVAEPLFGRDVGIYVFVLPAIGAALAWLLLLTFAVGLVTGAAYLALARTELGVTARRAPAALGRGPRLHLGAVAAVLLLLLATAHQLGAAGLVLATGGQASGIAFSGYADAWARLATHQLSTLVALVAAGAMIVAASRGRHLAALWGLAGYAATLLLALVYPQLVHAVVVRPNEPERERPYITRLIEATRQAYGLDRVHEQFPPNADDAVPATFDGLGDLPLWDRLALRDVLNQLQAFRPYYHFFNVDLDRYSIGGAERQVLIAAREVNGDALPSRGWHNVHVELTHGYGSTLALAAGVVDEGSPRLLVQDLPPVGQISIERPEIFYGEATTTYALVGTKREQTTGEGPSTIPRDVRGEPTPVPYTGRGVKIGGLPELLTFALHLGDSNLLLADAITPEAQILVRRQIDERIGHLAPFLRLDPDPYLVIADGRLFWIVDAYTATDRYPLSWQRPLAAVGGRLGGDSSPINYVRNSVKVVVDAYRGDTRFFLADPSDPIAHTYARIYPSLFEPLSAMPSALRPHLRYPEQLFATQAEVLTRFHVSEPLAFYHGQHVWQVAREKLEARIATRPQYLLTQLPGEERQELLLVQPFSPVSRTNDQHHLTGVLIARSDPPHAGELVLQRYSGDRLVEGPFQAELRIEQDPDVTAQFSLWQRAGLLVVRSNLITLPIGPTPLYVESVYVQRGARPTIPELKRVIVAYGNQLAMEPTLDRALARLSGASSTKMAEGSPLRDDTLDARFRALQERLVRAREALANGDHSRYADELAEIQVDLRRLQEQAGR